MPGGPAQSRPNHRRPILLAATALIVLVAALPAACSGNSAGQPTGQAQASITQPSPTGPATLVLPSAPPAPPITIVPTTTAAPTTTRPQSTTQVPAGPSAQQLAGERIVYSYTGLTPPANLLALIRAGDAAGVIFFTDNISSSAQISAAIGQLRQAQQQSSVHLPLLLMTDQEGGQVRRLPGSPALSEQEIGQSADPLGQAAQAGTSAAQNLAGIGMNVNLAPVLDVYYQPGDFIDQFQRSYSSDPTVVSSLGSAFITAQQQGGVAATAKHFPGLGSAATAQNTDAGPVTLPVSLDQLRSTDELPYQSAIAAGVKLIMVSWAVYPALDPNLPAGLSPIVVQQELRGQLGYTGVTVTDALEAGALNAYGSPGQRALDAAGAGMDLLLCSSGDVSQGQDAAAALASAFSNGQLNQASFNAAVDRVNSLRAGLS
jgi:beta-N-acetylhexosaminidase